MRALRVKAIADRVLGTLRRECLDHLIVLDEGHLRSVLREFVALYNRDRPHRTLRLETPLPAERPKSPQATWRARAQVVPTTAAAARIAPMTTATVRGLAT